MEGVGVLGEGKQGFEGQQSTASNKPCSNSSPKE